MEDKEIKLLQKTADALSNRCDQVFFYDWVIAFSSYN